MGERMPRLPAKCASCPGIVGTVARSMPQSALLMILVLLPLQMLSGGSTPRGSMPDFIQTVMLAAPTTHFVMFALFLAQFRRGVAVAGG